MFCTYVCFDLRGFFLNDLLGLFLLNFSFHDRKKNQCRKNTNKNKKRKKEDTKRIGKIIKNKGIIKNKQNNKE